MSVIERELSKSEDEMMAKLCSIISEKYPKQPIIIFAEKKGYEIFDHLQKLPRISC